MKNFRTSALLGTALAAVLVLAGCAAGAEPNASDSGSNPTAADPAAFNSADEMFASMMIPHHEQAVDMADMILGKNGIDDRVIELAQQIKAAQDPEIATMKGWLADWGIEYMDSGMGGMEGMDHGDGMMSNSDMDQLDNASGADASRLFLEQMIEHHEGAITMAQTEINNGENSAAVDLAAAIVAGQTTEVDTMRKILGSL
ncbi:MAG: DUF305 domain-containing protein [Microbacteriaceae bacterium]